MNGWAHLSRYTSQCNQKTPWVFSRHIFCLHKSQSAIESRVNYREIFSLHFLFGFSRREEKELQVIVSRQAESTMALALVVAYAPA